MSGIKKLVKELEVKYGNTAKVKNGKPYAAMTAARPSNTMHIIVLYKDGKWQEYSMSLDESGIKYGEVDTVCFVYFSHNYLTINTYSPQDVLRAKGDMPAVQAKQRSMAKQRVTNTNVRSSKLLDDEEYTPVVDKPKIVEVKEPETSGLDEDVDLPW